MLAQHVVAATDRRAGRRSAQHPLAVAAAHEVREVRVAAGELLDAERCVIGEALRPQEGREALGVELFAGADGPRFVEPALSARHR